MTGTYQDDSWLPQSVRDADAALDEAVLHSKDMLKELDKLPPSEGPQISDEAVRRAEQEAKSPKASPEMRALQRKVDAGEVTWRDILEGRAFDNPDVRAALQARLGELREAYQEFEQGYTLDDVLEAHRGGTSVDDDEPPESFLR